MDAETTAIIGVTGVLLGSLFTVDLAHYREKGNRKNALELKKREIAGQYNQKWFEDRMEAYAKLTNVTSTIQTENFLVTHLSQALTTVRLVSDFSHTIATADDLVDIAKKAS